MFQPSLLDDYPSRVRRFAVVAVILVVLGALGYRVAAIVAPPLLAIEQPSDALSTTSRLITIRGITSPGATITVNGQAFVPDARGAFTKDIVLVPGVNIIEFEARTKHSRTTKVIRRIQVITSEAPVAIRNDEWRIDNG